MGESPQDQVVRVRTLFDTVAGDYDQSGVPFFATIAQGLVALLAPTSGEQAFDVGCGRGAATVALARAVGPTGHVRALDLSPAMVALCRTRLRDLGLSQVDVEVGDATAPGGEADGLDLVAASLVLFFLPDPVAALRGWIELLRPGGRLGFTSFRPWPETWARIEAVFDEHPGAAPPGLVPLTALPQLFSDDSLVEEMVRAAGGRSVRTVTRTYAVPFDGVEQWRAWSMGTALRGRWASAPPETHPAIEHRIGELLESTRDGFGPAHLDVGVRHTLALA